MNSVSSVGQTQNTQMINTGDIAAVSRIKPSEVTKAELQEAIDFFNKNPSLNDYKPTAYNLEGQRSFRITADPNPVTGKKDIGIEVTTPDPSGRGADTIQYIRVYFRNENLYLTPDKTNLTPSRSGGVPADMPLREIDNTAKL
jgi:hypothetical protein